MIKLSKFILCTMLVVLLASCGDDGNITLNITAPADGTSYAAGDMFSITGTATDDVALTSISASSPDLGLTSQSFAVADSSVTVTFTFDVTLSATQEAGDYDIEITALDGEGNSESEKVEITVN